MPSIDEQDVVYGVADGRPLSATLYEPPAGARSTLVDVHGGAWTTGTRRTNQLLDRALAASGCRVLAIDFRHGPEFRHPAAIRDITAAVRFLRVHAERLGVDPDRIGLLGSSSGGHLALLAGLQPNAPAHRGTAVALDGGTTTPAADVDAAVDHVVALWPVSDPLRRYRYARAAGRDDLADRHLQYFADEAAMAGASVQRALRAGEAERVPAALVVQPGADQNVPLAMTLDLIDAYQSRGGMLDYAFYPGLPHAFAQRAGDATDDLVRAIASFVARRATGAWTLPAGSAGASGPRRATIDEVLARARERIRRFTPAEAAAAQEAGALLVDTRDSADRAAEGVIPGALWIPSTVLAWRADPTSELPDPRLADPRRRLIIVCNDGYSSSLAAERLVTIGFAEAGDLAGGFRAWKAAGLPIENAG